MNASGRQSSLMARAGLVAWVSLWLCHVPLPVVHCHQELAVAPWSGGVLEHHRLRFHDGATTADAEWHLHFFAFWQTPWQSTGSPECDHPAADPPAPSELQTESAEQGGMNGPSGPVVAGWQIADRQVTPEPPLSGRSNSQGSVSLRPFNSMAQRLASLNTLRC